MILASTKGELFRIEEGSASRAYSSEKKLGCGQKTKDTCLHGKTSSLDQNLCENRICGSMAARFLPIMKRRLRPVNRMDHESAAPNSMREEFNVSCFAPRQKERLTALTIQAHCGRLNDGCEVAGRPQAPCAHEESPSSAGQGAG